MRWAWSGVVALVAVGCTRHNPASCADGACTDPTLPFCDEHGVISGEPLSCIAVTCAPSTFAACDGSSAITCNATGDGYDVAPCDNGCSDVGGGCAACEPNGIACSGTTLQHCDANGAIASAEACAASCESSPSPHCARLQPRYLPTVCDTPATSDLEITHSQTIDADADLTCNGGIVAQAGGRGICVVHYRQISVDAGALLKVTATAGGNAIAFVADGPLSVAGAIDVSGTVGVNGPGGGVVTSGGQPSATNGGGGAGFHTAGSAGGSETLDGGATDGGAVTSDPVGLVALAGGPRASGGGGGAMTLISCGGQISVSGNLVASGGGGVGGFHYLGAPVSGAAGGAGGYVVLQGMAITVTGNVYANGGGGGAGATAATGTDQQNGQDGAASDTLPASGGIALPGAGAGGDGGNVAIHPSVGRAPTTSGDKPGGGGGSMGFFQTYTPAGITPVLTPAHASPPFQPNATVPTH